MANHNIASSQVVTATGMLKNHLGGILGTVRVQSLYATPTSAGNLELRDGSATGPLRLVLPLVAEADSLDMSLPGDGILFLNGVHVTLGGAASVVLFYEG